MLFVRYLSWATAYAVIVLELYSGALQGPIWWALPGGLVLCLLLALAHYAGPLISGATQNETQSEPRKPGGTDFGIWILILVFGFGMSFTTNILGRTLIRDTVIGTLGG